MSVGLGYACHGSTPGVVAAMSAQPIQRLKQKLQVSIDLPGDGEISPSPHCGGVIHGVEVSALSAPRCDAFFLVRPL